MENKQPQDSDTEDMSSTFSNDCFGDFEDNHMEDTRSELKFDEVIESEEEKAKRQRIEDALKAESQPVEYWKKLAIESSGLVGDDLRCVVWPLLLEVDSSGEENIPSLDELSSHVEYNQVVLDVNRALKRFPPGIPYKKRLALQDQLTVLIMRILVKYPHLNYYQGYHDVAITFLLVVGETVAFRIMEKLSNENFVECMERTMEKTSYRLNYLYAILSKADPSLHDFMDKAAVGTLFALPWFITWFGHSLNQYKDVVRLYDFFLATPSLMPVYVASSLVMERREEILLEGCDMASIHCLLSQIPDNLDFETILVRARELYKKFPPEKLQGYVKKRVKKEHDERKQLERKMQTRRNKVWLRRFPTWILFRFKGKYGILFAAATVLLGVCAYYMKTSKANFSFTGMLNT